MNVNISPAVKLYLPPRLGNVVGGYHLVTKALFDLRIAKATPGCQGDWNLLDHFDPTVDLLRLFKKFFDLHVNY